MGVMLQRDIHFLKIVRGSLLELETQIIITKELGFINQEKHNVINSLIIEESKMLNAFIRSIRTN